MHSLLKRQLRKYLPKSFESQSEVQDFLKAVEKSYHNYDEKLSMLHRATTISSEELYEANHQLEKEAIRQKNILGSLENAIGSLIGNFAESDVLGQSDKMNINAEQLAKHISNLATQVSEMTSEKDKLLKHLEAQNQSLNNYAHMVSHDLKSPIRNINALMSWIQDEEKEKFSDASKENCSLVSQNLERMDKLISGILNHASLDKTTEKRISFDLKELLKDIERTIYIPKNVKIIYGDDLPVLVFEKERMEQLFMNLMTNAVTAIDQLENGIIHIDCQPDESFWKFKVSDNGKGIPERHQKGIFKMFKKLESDGNSTGIGLAIVKKIVELYEGEIWLESQENKGTTFYFTLKK